MSDLKNKLIELKQFQEDAIIRIQTLGQFNLWRENEKVDSKQFGRDKAIQLLQYLISNRHRHALHKGVHRHRRAAAAAPRAARPERLDWQQTM